VPLRTKGPNRWQRLGPLEVDGTSLEGKSTAYLTVAGAAWCSSKTLLVVGRNIAEVAGVADIRVRSVEADAVEKVEVVHLQDEVGTLAESELLGGLQRLVIEAWVTQLRVVPLSVTQGEVVRSCGKRVGTEELSIALAVGKAQVLVVA